MKTNYCHRLACNKCAMKFSAKNYIMAAEKGQLILMMQAQLFDRFRQTSEI